VGGEIELDSPASERDPGRMQAAAQIVGEIGFVWKIKR
jgi:hypothetical protein